MDGWSERSRVPSFQKCNVEKGSEILGSGGLELHIKKEKQINFQHSSSFSFENLSASKITVFSYILKEPQVIETITAFPTIYIMCQ